MKGENTVREIFAEQEIIFEEPTALEEPTVLEMKPSSGRELMTDVYYVCTLFIYN